MQPFLFNLCLWLGVGLAAAPPRAVILGPGVYLRADVPQRWDGAWLALHPTEDGWCLESARPARRPTTLGRRFAAWEISVPGKPEAVLLVQGIPGLSPGKVMEAEQEHGEAPDGVIARGRLQNTPYVLTSEVLPGSGRHVLRLEAAGINQVLEVGRAEEEAEWEVLWAGDLDGDHRLDLLLASLGNAPKGRLQLFLSGPAESHQLVARVGVHVWTAMD